MDIDFDVKEARPGKEVVVSVKADPDSTVHLLAVDKSVLILRSDNDIKESRVATCFVNLPLLTSNNTLLLLTIHLNRQSILTTDLRLFCYYYL